MTKDDVQVTQEDREAWIAYEANTAIGLNPVFVSAILNGKHDNDKRLRTFTAHRIAMLEALSARVKALERVSNAAQVVLYGLNKRIDAAFSEGGRSVPVFTGIADLSDALNTLAALTEGTPHDPDA